MKLRETLARLVTCPSCGSAPEGAWYVVQPCRTRDGVATSAHAARVRFAELEILAGNATLPAQPAAVATFIGSAEDYISDGTRGTAWQHTDIYDVAGGEVFTYYGNLSRVSRFTVSECGGVRVFIEMIAESSRKGYHASLRPNGESVTLAPGMTYDRADTILAFCLSALPVADAPAPTDGDPLPIGAHGPLNAWESALMEGTPAECEYTLSCVNPGTIPVTMPWGCIMVCESCHALYVRLYPSPQKPAPTTAPVRKV